MIYYDLDTVMGWIFIPNVTIHYVVVDKGHRDKDVSQLWRVIVSVPLNLNLRWLIGENRVEIEVSFLSTSKLSNYWRIPVLKESFHVPDLVLDQNETQQIEKKKVKYWYQYPNILKRLFYKYSSRKFCSTSIMDQYLLHLAYVIQS